MDLSWLSSLSLYTKISIWTTILPMAFSLLATRRFVMARLMLILFCAGLFTELSTQKTGGATAYSQYAFLVYSLLECTLFFYMVRYQSVGLSMKRLLTSVLIFTLPVFVFSVAISTDLQWAIAVFNMTYQVGIALLAGRILLTFVEHDDAPSFSPMFWLMLGIFFYCFTTFFLMGIIGLTATYVLWDKYHNSINIVTYLIYTFAFWKAYRTGRNPVTILMKR